ncbi:MAG: stage 0 sporulation protein [Anaerolineae bacterium]|nr:MAG: stage 0 sporulation protein [Anaerolineae bacterium]
MPDNNHYGARNGGVVGVRFQKVGKVYHFSAAGIEGLKEGDFVIVETARGQELAQVVQVGLEPRPGGLPLKPIARRAVARDMAVRQRYKLQEKEALHVCRQKVEELDLAMRIPRVEYSYDGRRLTVYFMADEKVECRALRRELGRHFRTRVNMQPVGARDLAKMLGGCGACGGLLCCATFLAEFAPVSIKVAKAQDVTLVPSEITGMCGRLRCCLRYEYQTYKEARQAMPERGCRVVTRSGRGRVVQINVLKDTVVVDFGTYQAEVPLASLEVEPEGCSGECDPT